MESSHPAWQTGVQFVLCRRRSPSSQVTFASICALCEEKWQCKQHTFALPMFTKKTPKMLFWKEHYCWKWLFVGFYVSKFSGVFLAQPNRNKMASEWLGFGDSFCGKTVRQWRGYTYHRCASTKIYMYYILFICTYMWHNIPIILAISNNHGMIAIMNSWLWSPLLFACFCIVYLLLFLLLWLT